MTQSPHRKRCGLLLCPHTMPADCAHAGYTAPPAAKNHMGDDIAINEIGTDQADNDGDLLVRIGHAGDEKSTKKADKTMRRGGKDRATQRRAMIWLICSDKKKKRSTQSKHGLSLHGDTSDTSRFGRVTHLPQTLPHARLLSIRSRARFVLCILPRFSR